MDLDRRIKVAACFAFGLLFRYVGWLMIGLRIKEKAIKYGGRCTLIGGSLLLAYGLWLYVESLGIATRQALLKNLGVALLAAAAVYGLHQGLVSVGEKFGSHERFTAFVLLVIMECLVFWWADRRARLAV
jgi:hypothetical protein